MMGGHCYRISKVLLSSFGALYYADSHRQLVCSWCYIVCLSYLSMYVAFSVGCCTLYAHIGKIRYTNFELWITNGNCETELLTLEWTRWWHGYTLASNPGFPFRILSHSFREKSDRKPGRISHVIRWHRHHSSTSQTSKTAQREVSQVRPTSASVSGFQD